MSFVRFSIVLIAFLGASFCNADFSLDEPGDEFFEDAVYHCATLSESYSVLGSFDVLEEKVNKDGSNHYDITNKLFRIVKSGSPVTTRLDLRTKGPETDEFDGLYENLLVSSSTSLFALGMRPGVFNDQRSNVNSMHLMRKFDFPSAPLSTLYCIDAGVNLYTSGFGRFVVIHEEDARNGDRILWVKTSGNDQIVTMFRWQKFKSISMPVEISWHQAPPASKLDSSSQQNRSYQKWRQIQWTKSVWNDSKENGPVPVRVAYTYSVEPEKEKLEAELRFLDWKFGDQVDLQLLDKSKFDTMGIRSSVDFAEWDKQFDNWKVEKEQARE
ncbi:MAG: hypothetical protein MUC83_03180 [Pirellula sp.]|nr:hypothetical protein [Pirellula sp.]